MPIICYGCDCAVAGKRAILGSSLRVQRERLIGHLGADFNQKNWYSDTGEEILVPFASRPGGLTCLMRLSRGDTLYIDAPERIYTSSRSSKRIAGLLKRLGITIKTLIPGFETIDYEGRQYFLACKRYGEMLCQLGTINGLYMGERGSPVYFNKMPLGWKVDDGRVRPDVDARMLCKIVYDAVIDNYINLQSITQILNLKNSQAVQMCRAYEAGFPLRNKQLQCRRPLPGTGPSIPNVQMMLQAIAERPMSIREIANACYMTPLHVHLVFTRLAAYQNYDEIKVAQLKAQRNKNAVLPEITILKEIRHYTKTNTASIKMRSQFDYHRPTVFTIQDEFLDLVLEGSDKIPYWKIADSINGVSGSAHIFLGLDGADYPVPSLTTGPSSPAQDSPGTRTSPSHQPDPRPSLSEEEPPASPGSSRALRRNSSAPGTLAEYRVYRRPKPSDHQAVQDPNSGTSPASQSQPPLPS